MAHPKRGHSNARSGKRRTHHNIDAPNLNKCRNCGEPKLPHRICKKCGFYNGKQVVVKKEKKDKKKQ